MMLKDYNELLLSAWSLVKMNECAIILIALHFICSFILSVLCIISSAQLLSEQKLPPDDYLRAQLAFGSISLVTMFLSLLGMSQVSLSPHT